MAGDNYELGITNGKWKMENGKWKMEKLRQSKNRKNQFSNWFFS